MDMVHNGINDYVVRMCKKNIKKREVEELAEELLNKSIDWIREFQIALLNVNTDVHSLEANTSKLQWLHVVHFFLTKVARATNIPDWVNFVDKVMCALASQSRGEDSKKVLKILGLWKSSGFFPAHLKEWKARIAAAADVMTQDQTSNNVTHKFIDLTEVVKRKDDKIEITKASEVLPVNTLSINNSCNDLVYARFIKVMWALFDDLAGQYKASDKDYNVSRTAHGPCSGRLANNTRSSLDALDFVKSAAFWFLCRYVYSNDARGELNCNTAALVLACTYLAGKSEYLFLNLDRLRSSFSRVVAAHGLSGPAASTAGNEEVFAVERDLLQMVDFNTLDCCPLMVLYGGYQELLLSKQVRAAHVLLQARELLNAESIVTGRDHADVDIHVVVLAFVVTAACMDNPAGKQRPQPHLLVPSLVLQFRRIMVLRLETHEAEGLCDAMLRAAEDYLDRVAMRIENTPHRSAMERAIRLINADAPPSTLPVAKRPRHGLAVVTPQAQYGECSPAVSSGGERHHHENLRSGSWGAHTLSGNDFPSSSSSSSCNYSGRTTFPGDEISFSRGAALQGRGDLGCAMTSGSALSKEWGRRGAVHGVPLDRSTAKNASGEHSFLSLCGDRQTDMAYPRVRGPNNWANCGLQQRGRHSPRGRSPSRNWQRRDSTDRGTYGGRLFGGGDYCYPPSQSGHSREDRHQHTFHYTDLPRESSDNYYSGRHVTEIRQRSPPPHDRYRLRNPAPALLGRQYCAADSEQFHMPGARIPDVSAASRDRPNHRKEAATEPNESALQWPGDWNISDSIGGASAAEPCNSAVGSSTCETSRIFEPDMVVPDQQPELVVSNECAPVHRELYPYTEGAAGGGQFGRVVGKQKLSDNGSGSSLFDGECIPTVRTPKVPLGDDKCPSDTNTHNRVADAAESLRLVVLTTDTESPIEGVHAGGSRAAPNITILSESALSAPNSTAARTLSGRPASRKRKLVVPAVDGSFSSTRSTGNSHNSKGREASANIREGGLAGCTSTGCEPVINVGNKCRETTNDASVSNNISCSSSPDGEELHVRKCLKTAPPAKSHLLVAIPLAANTASVRRLATNQKRMMPAHTGSITAKLSDSSDARGSGKRVRQSESHKLDFAVRECRSVSTSAASATNFVKRCLGSMLRKNC